MFCFFQISFKTMHLYRALKLTMVKHCSVVTIYFRKNQVCSINHVNIYPNLTKYFWSIRLKRFISRIKFLNFQSKLQSLNYPSCWKNLNKMLKAATNSCNYMQFSSRYQFWIFSVRKYETEILLFSSTFRG